MQSVDFNGNILDSFVYYNLQGFELNITKEKDDKTCSKRAAIQVCVKEEGETNTFGFGVLDVGWRAYSSVDVDQQKQSAVQ